MIYKVKTDNYHTFSVFEKNKLPPRAYFIPFSERDKALSFDVTESRYHSDLATCLSGEWDFCFFKDPKTLDSRFDTDTARFDKVTVPSVWEYTGYLDPMYLCTYAPFFFDPPKIPQEKEIGLFRLARNNLHICYAKGQYNSIGIYRKKFFAKDVKTKSFVLSFLGVAPCFDLFLNGNFVGYSEGTHNTAEFLIDNFLVEGENEIVVVVHRFCNGTYLETQDMYRNSGIFRDVLLFVTEKKHIRDYFVSTENAGEKRYDLKVTVWVENADASDEVSIEFFGERYAVRCDENGKAVMTLNNIQVEEWSAETPTLYPLIIGYGDREFLLEQVGFCYTKIEGEVYYFNGKNIKIKGVNHHDTHPVKGSAMSVSDMERDVRLMKEYNVNAVRTSHYSPDPAFVRLCRRYGLYLIEEADIETHCTHAAHNLSYISGDARWKEHYLDRVKRMYGRDRNLCNVVLWSLGNESGGLLCQKYCYDYLKTQTKTPIHYEWAQHSEKVGFDVLSEMYTPLETMKKNVASRATNPRRRKPYFLCEYAHAMGVGPGSLEDYVELFLSDDIYMGGCIWEWADHSVYHKDTGNYTYGGDHHDFINDKTFCIDGLFRPDREPYTSAYSMKTAYRPVRAKYLGEGEVDFFNTDRFVSTERLLVTYALSVAGAEEEERSLPFVLGPGEKKSLKVSFPAGEDAFLNIKYVEKTTGRPVAEEQVTLSERMPVLLSASGEKPSVRSMKKTIEVSFGKTFSVVFDKKKGGVCSYKVNDVELLFAREKNERRNPGVYESIFRAPLCNDLKVKKKWKRLGLDRYRIGWTDCKVVQTDDVVTVTFCYRLHNFCFPLAAVCDVYTLLPGGRIKLESVFTPSFKAMLPRVGKTFELDKQFDHVRYYGRGERESYPDMKAHAKVGIYERSGDFGEKMIVPQNSGERCDVRWAEVTDEKGRGIRFVATDRAFGFNLNHYDEKTLASWKHIVDYKDTDATFVNIDGFLCGVGSASCGPLPERKYRIPEKEMLRFSFFLEPIFGKE